MKKVRTAAYIVAGKYPDFSAVDLENDWINWYLAKYATVAQLVEEMSKCCEEELKQWEVMCG